MIFAYFASFAAVMAVAIAGTAWVVSKVQERWGDLAGLLLCVFLCTLGATSTAYVILVKLPVWVK